MTRVAIVHDYLTQRGGAERVVLSMAKAFPATPIFTSLYDPDGTYPEFRDLDVRPMAWLNRAPLLRRHHRAALPLLAPAFSRLHVEADVVLCSSSGWAHGTRVAGRKIVYCHTPARWLYQQERYLDRDAHVPRLALAALRGPLMQWDRRAAASADLYLANSTAVAARVQELYGITAQVVPAPHSMDPGAPQVSVDSVTPDFFLCVSRLLPYKNVHVLLEAFRDLPHQLVIVGTGPQEPALRGMASPNVRLLGRVSDPELRWLYANCQAVVSASYEDYGLTPLEAAAFGKPAVVLRWGGFLDTVIDGVTGLLFDSPEPVLVRRTIQELCRRRWPPEQLVAHAAAYSEQAFADRLRELTDPR